MSILVSNETAFLVQGITGHLGSQASALMRSYGTPIVAGVTPGKGGDWLHGIPIFDTVSTAIAATGANASLVFVNPEAAADAIHEAIACGLELIICVTSGIPVHDLLRIRAHLARYPRTRLIGTSSPGLLVPGVINAGIVPPFLGIPGVVGVVSRGASLAFDLLALMTEAQIGLSAFVGIGTDPISGTSFTDILHLFEEDPDTRAVVLLGEIGGSGENRAAEFILDEMTKPVIAHVVGRSLRPGVRLGDTGAVLSDAASAAEVKIDALRSAGARITDDLPEILAALRESGF